MTKHGLITFIAISFLRFGSLQSTKPEEGILLENLLQGRSNEIRPLPKEEKRPTVVNISIRIIQPLEIDERNEILSLLTWTNMYWEDSTFTWSPGAHSNIKKLLFPAEHIWTPDVFLHNTQEISSGLNLGLPHKEGDLPFLATASPNGLMSLSFPHIFKSTCKIKISEYPFDTQNCPLIFGSWSYNESEVVININVLRSDAYTVSSKAWQLMETECNKKPSRCAFEDAGENCQTMHCFIGLKRTAWFEVISYTLPTIVIAALSIMVFMVPPEAGKRMEVGITLILCVAVYLSLINKKMPSTSESFPLVSKFYGCVIVEITIAMVCSCYCLHIYDPEGLRLLHFPNHLRTLAFGILARITFYRTKGGKTNRVHPTNAEVKIVEKRRRSMIAINGSIQLSQNSNLARKRALDSKENGQFRMQMEDIKECSEGTETIEEEKRRENSNNNSIQRDEENRERVAELSLENVEEEIIGEEMNAGNHNLNENQNNGENRCDSGFGEPGGSMSNRSSLLSSNSVPLPVEANSTPPPQCGDNCDCGQPGCNGQGVMGNSEPSQDVSTGDNTVEQEENLVGNNAGNEREKVQFAILARSQSKSKEIWPLRRAQTGLTGEAKISSGGPLSQMLSARPYTDSVLVTWKRKSNIKQFRPSLRANASLSYEDNSSSDIEAGGQSRKLSTARDPSKNADQDENVRESNINDVSGNSDQSGSRINAKRSTDDSGAGSSGKINRINNQANTTVDTLVSKNESSVKSDELGVNNEAFEENKNEIRAEANLGEPKSNTMVGNSMIKTPQSKDEMELVDFTEEETLESISDSKTHDAAIAAPSTETFDIISSNEKERITQGIDSTSSSTRENQQPQTNRQQETGSDTETDGEANDDEKRDAVRRRDSEDGSERRSSIIDPKVLFARRQWDILRDRMQRRITVKEVFGQILSPKETSPIVAIANVLLRDQRKYVMRTEWMTSAIIINRFFIILLALAVFISLLAVFMQSSRLRAFFDF